ncbi:MAG: YeeE/YedE thiosulfate transporter family protein, partial [Bacteroidota bacterium]
MLETIQGAWHWFVSGTLIALVMFSLLYAGKEFGVSSNMRTMCSIAGAGKFSDYFRFDWKSQQWNLLFIAGAVIGGLIGVTLLANPDPVQISASTEAYLSSLGIAAPSSGEQGGGYVPQELFGLDRLSLTDFGLLALGGFLIGFGTRWAGGCTSGHAISGLSNLQLPSLIAVIGFFIGGLLMTWLILPS